MDWFDSNHRSIVSDKNEGSKQKPKEFFVAQTKNNAAILF